MNAADLASLRHASTSASADPRDSATPRERILRTLSFVATSVLRGADPSQTLPEALRRLGEAVAVSRAYVFENFRNAEGALCCRQLWEWCADGIGSELDNPELQCVAYTEPVLVEWRGPLERGEVIQGHVGELGGGAREFLEVQGIRSILLVPIFVDGDYWGFIGFDECRFEREWTDSELQPLGATAEVLGASLARRSAEQRFRLLAEHTSDMVALHEPDGRYVYVSPAASDMLGYSPAQMVGRSPYDFIHADDRDWLRERAHQPLLAGETMPVIEYRMLRADGSMMWAESRAQVVSGDHGEVTGIVSSTRDVSTRRRLAEDTQHERDLAQTTLSAIADGVISVDASGHVQYLNPAAERLTGWSVAEAIGHSLGEVFHIVERQLMAGETHDFDERLRRLRRLSERPLPLRTRGGAHIVVQYSIATRLGKRMQAEEGAVVVFRDVTEATTLAQELAYRASHDSLTGLFNREEFDRHLKRILEDARQSGRTHALCYLDLDQFKLVNDTCGHVAGDQLLRQIPVILRQHVREHDVIARLGGDEFGLLLFDTPIGVATERADTLLQALEAHRFRWQDRSFGVGGSIGIAPITHRSENAEGLLIAADAACYAAKEKGRHRVHVFEPDDAEVARKQGELQWVARLQAALETDDFKLLAQDIVPTVEPGMRGTRLEVLLALPDLRGNYISPSLFLPAAQRYGIMSRIDRWVVSQVIARLARRERTGGAPLHVSVNLSGSSLSDEGFIDFVEHELRELRNTEQLAFEITESEAIANLGDTHRLIQRIKARGCQFALDDFGSGLSSFAYLKSLPVDVLKIDGQFVRDAASDRVDCAMVEAIHRIGHVMGLKTVAEFVESEAILDKMAEIGIDYCQGYHLGRPRPMELFGL